MMTILLVVSLIAFTSYAQPTQPCGSYVQTFASPQQPTILAQWQQAASSMNITCGIAVFPSDAKALIPLGVVCSPTLSGPYFMFPKGPFVDYFVGGSYFVCPFPGVNYYSTVAYNSYLSPILVKSSAQAILSTPPTSQHELKKKEGSTTRLVFSAIAPSDKEGLLSHEAKGPSVCGGLFTTSVNALTSKVVIYWNLVTGYSFRLDCYANYADTVSDLEAVLACSDRADFSSNVVPLGQVGAYQTAAVRVTCPFKGYFGVIVRNLANRAAMVSYYATGVVGGATETHVAVQMK